VHDHSDHNPSPASGRSWLWPAVGLVVTTLALVGGIGVALEFTSTTEFCSSCHSMQVPFKELEGKVHWKNRPGVHAGCANCHIPKPFLQKMQAKIMAGKDIFHEMLGTIQTPEKYEARRQEMAEAVWAKMKANDSQECKTCHSIQHMDFAVQDKFARKKHEGAAERGQTCIDCHKGIAHKMPTSSDESEPKVKG